MKFRGYWLIFLLVLPCISFSKNLSDTDSILSQVTLSTHVEPRVVPMNRTIAYTVKIAWEGPMQSIEIDAIEEPVLSNFDIVGSAASNKTLGIPGGTKAVKEVVYTLSPKSLGMGYVDPIAITYKETATGQTHMLKTERIGVEVISPIREKVNSMGWMLPAGIGVVLVILGCGVFIFIKRRKSSDDTGTEEIILEEACLAELKETVDLNSSDRRESFTHLSRLFRKYLSEKYGLSALEATTAELMQILKEQALDESLIRKSEQLFEKADLVKFSGQDAEKSELETAYTAVETVLESNLAAGRD